MNKKGVFDQMSGLAVSVLTVAIILVVGFLIIASAQTTMQSDSTACSGGTWNGSGCCAAGTICEGTINYTVGGNSDSWNASTTTQSALATIPNWIPIIIITVIGALLISLVAVFRKRQ